MLHKFWHSMCYVFFWVYWNSSSHIYDSKLQCSLFLWQFDNDIIGPAHSVCEESKSFKSEAVMYITNQPAHKWCVIGGSPTIISEVTLKSHTRNLEYCFVLEEWYPSWRNPQTVLVFCIFWVPQPPSCTMRSLVALSMPLVWRHTEVEIITCNQ
jgi:hypothetical protein